MKKYLIKFSRPLLLQDYEDGEIKFKNAYGFLAPYDKKEHIKEYADYLVIMHEYSNGGDKNPAISSAVEIYNLNDHYLVKHNDWLKKLADKCMKKLDLTYSIVVVDIDDINCLFLENSYISDENVMAELYFDSYEEKDDAYAVMLFNRPIWLSKDILWPNEDLNEKYFSIYGVVTKREIDSKIINSGTFYLGYLAMIEEWSLAGKTTSGFKAIGSDDGYKWIDRDGEVYACISKTIEKECSICRQKYNLKIDKIIEDVPALYIKDMIKDSFVIDKNIYDKLKNRI